jgi:hypothetical protein
MFHGFVERTPRKRRVAASKSVMVVSLISPLALQFGWVFPLLSKLTFNSALCFIEYLELCCHSHLTASLGP